MINQFEKRARGAREQWVRLKSKFNVAGMPAESKAINVQQFRLHLINLPGRIASDRVLFAMNINALSDSVLVSIERFAFYEAIFHYKTMSGGLLSQFLSNVSERCNVVLKSE